MCHCQLAASDTPAVEARQRLLPADEVRQLRLRWLREAGAAAADANLFGKWLVSKNVVTDYQAGILLRQVTGFIRRSPQLRERLKVVQREVRNGSVTFSNSLRFS